MANNDWDVVDATPLSSDDLKHPAINGLSGSWNVVDAEPVNDAKDWVIPPSAPNAKGTDWAVPPRADIHAHRHPFSYYVDPTENAPTPEDIGRNLMSGVENTREQVPGLAMQMLGRATGSKAGPGVGIFNPVVGDTIERVGGKLRDLGTTLSNEWQKGLTPAGKKAASGDLADHPIGSIVSSTAQSAPGMAAMASATGPLTKLAESSGVAARAFNLLTKLGVSPERAKIVASALPSSAGAGVSEGVFSGLQNAEQTGDEVRHMDPGLLSKHPYFQKAYAATDSSWPAAKRFASAREAVASAAENNVAISTGFWDTLTGMMSGGGILGQLERPSHGVIHDIVSGVKAEGGQEAVQSGGEQLLQNLAAKSYYDQSRPLMDQVGQQALIGGGSGVLMAIPGGAAHGLTRRDEEDQPASETSPQPSVSPPQPDQTASTVNEQPDVPIHVQTNPQTPLQTAAQAAHDATVEQNQWEPIESMPVSKDELAAASAPAQEPAPAPKPEPAPAVTPPNVPRVTTTSTAKPDDLLRFIARNGGISRQEASAQGIDPAHFNDRISRQVFGKPLFPRKGGMTMDDIAEKLSQSGFLPEGQYYANDALDKIHRALMGEQIYSMQDAPTVYEQQAKAREHDMEEAAQEQPHELDDMVPTPDVLEESGYHGEDALAQDMAALMLRGRQVMGNDEFEKFYEGFAERNDHLNNVSFEEAMNRAIEDHANAGPEHEASPQAGHEGVAEDLRHHGEEEAAAVGAEAGSGHAQAVATGNTGDLFGGKNATAQAIHDATIAKDERRNGSRHVPVEAGAGDLFSGKAKQTDIEDAATPAATKREPQTFTVDVNGQPVEVTHTADSVARGAAMQHFGFTSPIISPSGYQSHFASDKLIDEAGGPKEYAQMAAQHLAEQAAPEIKKQEKLKKQKAKEQPERRADTAQRKTVDQMSHDEMRAALLTDAKTGLFNERAYHDHDKLPVQVAIDIDSLKWVNDNMGHDSGDKMLKAMGEAMLQHTALGYRIGGDEFVVQAKNELDTKRIMEAIAKTLSEAEITVQRPDGSTITKKGVGFSYGYGKDLQTADKALLAAKGEREAAGQRAGRGLTPPGVVERHAERQHDQVDQGAEEVRPPEQPAEKPSNPATETPSKEGVSVSGGINLRDAVQSAWDKYDDTGEYTHTELVDAIEEAARQNDSPEADELLDAVKAYRREQDDDRELGGRGDMDSAEEAFNAAVMSAISAPPPRDAEEGPSGSVDRSSGKITFKHANVVIRQVRDRNAELLGTVIEPYDGTIEGARQAARRATERMWRDYGDASNIQSMIGATDESGKPKWAISPNFSKIAPVDSHEGRAIFGDPDAIHELFGKKALASPVDEAAHESATSPENNLPEPTQAQKEAGNYQKGHVRLHGLDISIENPIGSERSGVDKSGKPWSIEMQSHYGYIKGTVGKDKDHIDVFLGPHAEDASMPVFVVDQKKENGDFDEHKVMLGYQDATAATTGYHENYSSGWTGMDGLTEMSLDQFKDWLKSGKTKEPVSQGAHGRWALTQARNPEKEAANAGQFKEGDRIVIARHYNKELEGRHGVITKHNAYTLRTIEIFGGREHSETHHTFDVKTDAGVETNARAEDLRHEKGEAPKVTPDVVLPEGTYTPAHVLEIIKQRRGRARSNEEAALRARKQERIVELKKRAEAERKSAAKAQEAYDAWADKHPQEAAALRGNAHPEPTTPDERAEIRRLEGEEAKAAGEPSKSAMQAVRAAGLDVRKTKTNKGNDVWEVSGKTRDQKDMLKSLGGRWYGPKKVWSFYNGDPTDALAKRLGWKGEEVAPEPIRENSRNALHTEPVQNEGLGEETVQEPQKPVNEQRASEYGSKNKLVTKDRAEEIRAKLKAKLNQLNAGVDPEMMALGAELAVYHIEAGARQFAAFSKAMLADLGEKARPYLKAWYMGARNWPGMDKSAMNTEAELDQIPEQAEDNSHDVRTPNPETRNDQRSGEAGSDRGPDSRPLGDGLEGEGEGDGEGRNPDTAAQGTSRVGEGRASARSGGRAKQPSIGRRDSADLRTPNGPVTPKTDFVITDADEIGAGGLKTKARNNLDAIKLVKQLEEAGRLASPEEQKVLAKYVGWGGIKGAFDPNNKEWADLHEELKTLLTTEEFEAARASILNAHYTSPEVVRGMWAILRRFGFEGGRVLEPSMGVGNFIGLMPRPVHADSSVVGAELDSITGAIAKQLYQNADILSPRGFQDVDLADDYFDAAVGNPPFGSERLYDKKHPDLSKFSIHNYFLAKSLSKVRPGGLMAMVVSHNFMDGQKNQDAREWIADRANLIGAIRLPNTAFKGNANTEVVTDIVLFQKHGDGIEPGDRSWVSTGEITTPNEAGDADVTHTINQYFIDHSAMVLGEHAATGSMYKSDEYTVEPFKDRDLADSIYSALQRLPTGIYQKPGKPVTPETIRETIDANFPEHTKIGGYYVEPNGKIYRRVPDHNEKPRAEPVEFQNATQIERAKGLIGVRDALRSLMRQEADSPDDKPLAPLRKQLNRVYDAFVQKYGFINTLANRRSFFEDPDMPLLESLEPKYDPGISKAVAKKRGLEARNPSAEKADIFTKRVIPSYAPIESVTSAKDALAASLNQTGHVDLDRMSELYGKSPEEIAKELDGLIYQNPESEHWEPADIYLSGNVKAKLAQAEEAAKQNPVYQKNVEALKEVQPEDVEPINIGVRFGTPWVPDDVVKDFANHLLGTNATAKFIPAVGQWSIGFKGGTDGVAFTNTWGTRRVPADKLMDAILNLRQIVVKDNHGTRDEPKWVVNEEETEAARAKADAIRNKFSEWIWQDEGRRERLAKIYNDTYNTDRPWTPDGSHLDMPGMNPAITLYPHQKAAIWRALQTNNMLFDHVVGAGKTFEIIGSMLEMRRFGVARKPIVAVPNHLVRQWRDDFYKMYPTANVLATTEKDFEKANRKRLFSRIATGDWDAIVVAHSSFKKIGMPPDKEKEIVGEMHKDLSDAIEELKRERGDRNVLRDMERIKQNLESKLKRLADKTGDKDNVVTFDELGVDALAVDEAHLFKNLFYMSQMKGMAGMGNPAGSGRAFDLFVKVRYLAARDGRVLFGTGTPISNSLVEMYTMQRYMQYDELKARNIHLLDSWAKTFANPQATYEVNNSGTGYKMSTRFAPLDNLPELMNMYRSFADVVLMSDLKEQAKKRGKTWPVPRLKGGKPTVVVAERSPLQEKYYGIPEFVRDAEGNIEFEEKPEDIEVVESNNDPGKFFVMRVDSKGSVDGPFDTREEAIEARRAMLTTPVVKYNDGSIIHTFDNIRKITKETNGKVNALSVTTKARKAALDYRIIDPTAPDYAGSKVNLAVNNIVDEYNRWTDDNGAQLVFLDLSMPATARDKVAEQARKQAEKEAAESLENDNGEETEPTEGEPQEEEEKISLDQLSAIHDKFSVYDDLKAKLIARGIPENKIAFIHDYDTAAKKSELYKAVNAGRIRVLIGSTEKMGAGMNAQERLVAIHHLDAPWRPSDLEQRNGRIIRQGNALYLRDPDNFEVSEYRYATGKTYDTRAWQIIQNKATAIEQFRHALPGQRTSEDIDGEAANAAEMKAAASGNPLIQEEIKLRGDIRSLEAQQKAYYSSLFDLQRKAKYAQGASARLQARLSDLKKWTDIRDANPPLTGDDFRITIDGKKYTDRGKLAGPMLSKIKEAMESPSRATIEAGMYRGLHFGFRTLFSGDLGAFVSRDGADWTPIHQYGKKDEISPSGFVTRIDNFYKRLDDDVKIAENNAAQERDEGRKAAEEATKPFPKQKELEDARTKHREVVKHLRAAGGSVEMSPEMRAELEKAVTARKADVRYSFSREKAARLSGAMAASDVRRSIHRIVANWRNAPRIQVVQDTTGLPNYIREDLRRQGGGEYTTQGLYDTVSNSIWLIADQIHNGEEAQTVLFHEALAHYGLRQLLGKNLNPVLDQVAMLYGKNGLKDIADEYGLDLDEQGQRRIAAEEKIAHMAETGEKPALLQRVVAMVRDWLRRMGFSLKLNDADVLNLIAKSRRAVEKGLTARELSDGDGVRLARSKPSTLHGMKGGQIVASAALQPNGQYEIYWGNGPTLLQSQKFRRQTVASAAQVQQAFTKAGLTASAPSVSAKAAPPQGALFTGFDTPTETAKDVVLRHMQDRFRRLKTIEGAITAQGGHIDEGQDAYLWEELMHGKAEERIREFEEEHVKPLIEAINKAGVKVDDVDKYLYAMHAPERNAHINEINPYFRDNNIAGSGMSDDEAQQILDDFQRRGLTDKLHGIAERVYAINEERLRLLEDEGLENEKTLEMWREPYEHYVPLRGFEDEEGKDRPRIGRGFDIRGKESRRALGRGRKALSPLTYTITQMEESIIRAEKNDVGKAFLKLVEAHPNPDLWEINKVEYAPHYDSKSGEVVYGPKPGYQYADNVLSVKVDGEPTLITIHDDGLARAIKNLGPQTSNRVLSALATANRYLAAVSTSLNPEFVLTNFARDLQTALINLYGEQGARGHLKQPKGIVRKVMKDLPAAMAGVYAAERGVDDAVFGLTGKSKAVQEWAKHYTEYRAAGGKVGFFGLRDVETKRKEILRELKRADGGATAQAHKVIHLTGELIADVNTAVENAIRLSAYKNARDLGLSEMHAASLAKNLTVNFNRKGELGTIANAMYLFYNAGVQGSTRFIYALRSPKVQKIALGLVAAHFLLATLNRLIGGDDKDGRSYWDKIPNWIKDKNLIVMRPDGSGRYFMLPLPYGYNLFNVIGNTIDGVAHGHDPWKEAAHFVGAAFDAFNPLGGADGGPLQLISPTITDWIVQLWTNENFHGGKIMPDQPTFGIQKPDSQRYWSTVSPMSKWVADKLNELTGGNSVRPGKIDVSPETLDFIMDQVAGGSGAFLKRSANYVESLVSGEDVPDQNVPFVRRFVGQQSAFQTPGDFHTNRDAIYLAKEEVTALRKQGKFTEADAAAKKNIALIRLYPRARDLDQKMQDDNKRIRDIRGNRTMSETEKRDRIKRIQQRMTDDMDRFNKGYYEKTGNTPE